MYPDSIVSRGFYLDPAEFTASDGRTGRVWSEKSERESGMRYYGMEKRPSPPNVKIQTQTEDEDRRDKGIRLDGETIVTTTVYGMGAIAVATFGFFALQATG
jgi:hypothetical protein